MSIIANRMQTAAIRRFLAGYKIRWQSVQDSIFHSQRVVGNSRHMTRLIKQYLSEKDEEKKRGLLTEITLGKAA